MATIYDIPTELLLNIVSVIEDRSSLCNVALVSKLFQRLSESVLYHTYRNKVGGENNARVDPYSLISFTRSVVTNRRLASKVKVLDLGRWITRWETDLHDELLPISPHDLQLFYEVGSHLELSDKPDQEQGFTDNWGLSLHHHVEDALVRLLLSQLPELGSVRVIMGPNPIPPWSFVKKMARYPAAWPSGRLSKLRSLEVLHDTDDLLGVNLGRFAGFFELPSLREVRGCGWLEEDDPVWNWTAPPGSSSVTYLDLSMCAIHEVCLRALMETCPYVTVFKYSSSMNGTQQFTPRALKRILQPHRAHLNQLSLTMFSEHWEDFDIAADEYRIGSFRNFRALKHLDIEEYNLLGHGEWYEDNSDIPHITDLLPRSLESLKITKCQNMIKVALVEIAAFARKLFPRLKSVEVVMSPISTDEDLNTFASLFAQVGIPFSSSVEMDMK